MSRLHRTRHLSIRQQTSVINAIRAHLAELGIVAPGGPNGVDQLLGDVADSSDKRLPEVARMSRRSRCPTADAESPDTGVRPPDHGLAPILTGRTHGCTDQTCEAIRSGSAAPDSESSSDEPTNTEVETRKIDDPHINTHSSVAIPVQPNWQDFTIDRKALFPECNDDLKCARSLIDEARAISGRGHDNNGLTPPPV
jgi:hypothetical protein